MEWKMRSFINEKPGSFPGSICEPAPCSVPRGRSLQLLFLGDSLALPLRAFLAVSEVVDLRGVKGSLERTNVK